MRNQLALSGEKILEKIYPQLFHHVGMIRGEYLLRELNQNIILASCQEFVKDYLDTICSFYLGKEVWYRFSELTNTEANCLVGTREFFDEGHPLFGYRGTRRLLACLDEFQAEAHVVTEVYQTNPNLSLIFPFVNDADQLKQAITVLRQYGFTGKVGTMIELPSAYFDLDRILETGISKIVVGMNDLTSFIQKMNQLGIKCIIHYSSIPEIFDLEIDHPDHLKHIKEESKKLQRSTHDTARNVE
ncbi:TPA: putative PEP-binding protein [Streptococcus pneumoniae]|nr:PEP-utilizing enzyme, TIM barrel domain protein [Streptococcus pneumoniae]